MNPMHECRRELLHRVQGKGLVVSRRIVVAWQRTIALLVSSARNHFPRNNSVTFASQPLLNAGTILLLASDIDKSWKLTWRKKYVPIFKI
jgi:hypothetical protein